MALQKKIEVDNTGVLAEYIRVHSISLRPDSLDAKIVVVCGLYKDKVSRDEGKNPVTTISVNVSNDTHFDKILDTCYKAIKEVPELQDALDV